MRSWQLISLKRWLTSKQNWKQFVRSLAAQEHDQIKKTWSSTHVSPGATCFEQFRSITLSHHYDSKKGPCHHGTTFYNLSVLCAGGIPAHFSLRLWLANRSPHSPADRRLVSKECQTHCTLLKYEINLLERKPKTLRIERLRQLDRAAVKLSCNKLCQSVVNCVKTFTLTSHIQ